MPVDLAGLKAEIATDPAGLGYAPLVAAGNDSGVAGLLNATTGPGAGSKPVALPIPVLLQWTVAEGIRGAVATAAADRTNAAYGLCNGIQDMFWGAMGSSHVFDMSDPAVAGPDGLVAALVATGIMTAAQQAALTALATAPASRAEVLWGPGTAISANDVANSFGRF